MKRCLQCSAEFEDTLKQCPQDNSVLKPVSSDPLVGTCLADRYQIVSLLGSGGMGVVYKAHHMVMDRPVAIKMLHAHMVVKPEALRRFYAEAKMVAKLKHFNIITVYDFGIGAANQPYLVMDYVDGLSLKKLVEESGPLTIERIRPILKQIIDGLAYAHGESVIHRDLKPENIMLTGLEQDCRKVTLVDFGLAGLAAQGDGQPILVSKGIGSPYYMSPEQCFSSAVVDGRSDIYSLAVVLYEAMSGRLPYEAKSSMAMMESHMHETPLLFNLSRPGLKVCTEMTRVFNRALVKDPEDRYQTIEQFGLEMDEALERDIVKWKAVNHRVVVARQTLVNTKQILDQEAASENEGGGALGQPEFDLQFQTGGQFLSRQAAIEARLPMENKDVQVRQCFYCYASVPIGVQFCLNC